jgi:uncharacterized protein
MISINHPVTRAVFLAPVLVLAAASAGAETFDCTHPTPAIARIVCGDPALHAADQVESDAYDLALLAALDRASLRDEEGRWFQSEILTAEWYVEHGMKVDPAKLVQSYRQRADALRDLARRWHDVRQPVPADRVGATCLPLPSAPAATACQVADSGAISGEPRLRYQRQRYGLTPGESGAGAGAVIVFAASDSRGTAWTPIAAASSKHGPFAAPATIVSPDGKLLVLAATSDAQGDEAVSSLFRFADGTLEEIDDRSWLDALKSRLPDGLLLDPGIHADYAKMTAVATIARSESTCCPVGSRAEISLGIENGRVVVKDVSFTGP